MDAAELYWLYMAVGERKEKEVQELYEVARFQGILTLNPKLLKRPLFEVLPFAWEEGLKAIKQTPEEMKKTILNMIGSNVSKTPLKKVANERAKKKKRS